MSYDKSDTLNEFRTPNGVVLVAEDEDDKGSCNGCAFDEATVDDVHCYHTPMCGCISRSDGRGVVWVVQGDAA